MYCVTIALYLSWYSFLKRGISSSPQDWIDVSPSPNEDDWLLGFILNTHFTPSLNVIYNTIVKFDVKWVGNCVLDR